MMPNTYRGPFGIHSILDYIIIDKVDNWSNIKQCNIIHTQEEVLKLKSAGLDWIEVIDEIWDNNKWSDHRCVKVEFNTSINKNKIKIPDKPIFRINWNNENYKKMFVEQLNANLDKIRLKRFNKQLDNHKYCNNLLNEIITALKNSKLETLKTINIKRKKKHIHEKRKQAFNTPMKKLLAIRKFAKDKRDETKHPFYSRLLQATRRSFKKAQIQRKKNIRSKRLEELANNFLQNKNLMWRKIKKHNKIRVDVDIELETLIQHYKDLFNNLLMSDKSKVINDKQSKIVEAYANYVKSKKGVIKIYETEIISLIKKLGKKKATGYDGIENECYIYAAETQLPKMIAHLFETTINYGITLEESNMGLINTIIKDTTGDTQNVQNTRPITIGTTISSLMEYFLQVEAIKKIDLHTGQYGFRAKSSTSHAIFVMKAIIEDLMKKKKRGFAVFLDFSKAFDKVNRNKLFYTLIPKMNAHLWLFLYNYYKVSKIVIKINNETFSIPISTSIGVKQGGIISPDYFNINIDQLLMELEITGEPYKIEEIEAGTVVYADDTNSVAENEKAMALNLSIIDEYCDNYDIEINTKKTKWMQLGEKFNPIDTENNTIVSLKKLIEPKFYLKNREIEKVSSIKFLGFELTSDNTNEKHLKKRKSIAMAGYSNLQDLGIEESILPLKMKSLLFNAFFRSKLNYGMECIKLNSKQLKLIKTFEDNTIKRMLNLSTHSKSRYVNYAIKIIPTKICLIKRKLSFVLQLLENKVTSEIVLTKNSMVTNEILKYIGYNASEFTNKEMKAKSIKKLVINALKRIESLNSLMQEHPIVITAKYLLENNNHENADILQFVLEPGDNS